MTKQLTLEDFDSKQVNGIIFYQMKEPIGGYYATIEPICGGYDLKIFEEGEKVTENVIHFYSYDYRIDGIEIVHEMKKSIIKKVNEWFQSYEN